MSWFTKTFSTGIGQKLLMSLTGLFLISFLLVHLSGNLTLFNDDGGTAFNAYSEFMSTNILIRIMEIGLGLGFFIHILTSILVTLENRKARPQRYEKTNSSANSSFFSRNMFVTGSIVFVFLVVHLKNFFIDERFLHEYGSMFEAVKVGFTNPWVSGFYVLALIILAFHLNHAFQSAFQTLGWTHKKYTPIIQFLGTAYSVIVPAGFATMPIYFLLFY